MAEFKGVGRRFRNGRYEPLYTTPDETQALIISLSATNIAPTDLYLDILVGNKFRIRNFNLKTIPGVNNSATFELKTKEAINPNEQLTMRATLDDTRVGDVGFLPWFTISEGDLSRITMDVRASIVEL